MVFNLFITTDYIKYIRFKIFNLFNTAFIVFRVITVSSNTLLYKINHTHMDEWNSDKFTYNVCKYYNPKFLIVFI